MSTLGSIERRRQVAGVRVPVLLAWREAPIGGQRVDMVKTEMQVATAGSNEEAPA